MERETFTINVNPQDYNLDHIFDCGQCFRWSRQHDGSYSGVAMGRAVNIALSPAKSDADVQTVPDAQAKLTITGCDEKDYRTIWHTYLDMDRDYNSIKRTLAAADPTIDAAIQYGHGIRILRQDLWETIVSFIISQNNNIPRIKGCIENLCRQFGEPIEEAGSCSNPAQTQVLFNVPSPEKLASLTIDDLAPVRLGYRARYLIETSRSVCEKGLPSDYEELSSLCGVGPKVANCISLFGLGAYDSFPIDVWVRRVMNRLYGIDEKDIVAMRNLAIDRFGSLGGFAQQYLFYYIRSLEG